MPQQIPENRILPIQRTIEDLEVGDRASVDPSSFAVAPDRTLRIYRRTKLAMMHQDANVEVTRLGVQGYSVDFSKQPEYKFRRLDPLFLKLAPEDFIEIANIAGL